MKKTPEYQSLFTIGVNSRRRDLFNALILAVLMFSIVFPRAAHAVRPIGKDWLKTDVPKKDAICFCLYTVQNKIMKMSVQLYPLASGIDRTVELQIKSGSAWKTISKTKVSEKPYGAPQAKKLRWTAHFKIEKWPTSRNITYRVRAAGGAASYTGTIRKDPIDKKEIVVAAFTGNSNRDRRLKPDIIKNIKAQDPDLLFFSGDQSYDHKQHQQAWLLFGQQFGEIIKDRPTICLPDDHDIGQGNVWGESGIKATRSAGNDGGYFYSPQYINSVQNAQTWHLPDPFDPTTVKRNIGVYYTSLKIGRVDFAIIEDRKFKSGPKGLIPPMGSRPDHITDPLYDPEMVDIPEAVLLGDRQLKFLEEWGQDYNGIDMKAVLSQTVFANAAHLHGGKNSRLTADMDSNGWPQSGRNRALRVIRKTFAPMICGDQHLATIIHHGVNDFRDSGFSFCVPSIVNYYNRWWMPLGEPNSNPIKGGGKNTGDYYDGFHNKITMYAYANPQTKWKNRWGGEWGARAAGYGIIRFNTETRKITFECWPRGQDVTAANAEQYPGWPITINQTDNYSRTPIAYLPKIQVSGIINPVVQVIRECTEKVVYTLRIKGTTFRPKVFKDGFYTIKVGEQPNRMKTFTGINAQEGEKSEKMLNVSF